MIIGAGFPRRTTSQANESPHLSPLQVYQAVSAVCQLLICSPREGMRTGQFPQHSTPRALTVQSQQNFITLNSLKARQPPAESVAPRITGEILTTKIFMGMGFDHL